MLSYVKTIGSTWIGLVRSKKDKSKWEWIDGSDADEYTNWDLITDYENATDRECVYVNPEDGKWNLDDCTHKRPFICRISKERVYDDDDDDIGLVILIIIISVVIGLALSFFLVLTVLKKKRIITMKLPVVDSLFSKIQDKELLCQTKEHFKRTSLSNPVFEG